MRLFVLIAALFFCLSSQAQITITTVDMPSVGDTFQSYQDNAVPGFSIGQSGANRTWDFTNLQPDVNVTTYAVAPASTPYAGSYPNANLVLTNDFNAYLYYRNTAQALKAEGFASIDPNLGTVTVNFNPIPDQYRFPTDYLGNFSGSTGFVAAKPYSQLPPNIQQQIDAAIASFPGASVNQVRVTFTSNYKDTIDAWGTVTTPLGSYEALRRKRIENSTTLIEAEVHFILSDFWTTVTTISANNTEHSWLSKTSELPLVSLGYDSLRNIISVTYSATPPPPVAAFTWTNPSGGLVNFVNTSQNATSYSWDFGDGGSSTLETPTHVYTANGAYYVCLTATNSAGSDTICDSVRVTNVSLINNPPIAVRDTAQVVYPNTLSLNVLTNDIDPDGNSIIFSLLFETPLNGNASDEGGGVIEYTPNASFRGIDSFTYIIVDDGSPAKKDTGTVVVQVDGAPFANFSYASSGFAVTFQNLSSGEDSIFWDLGHAGATATTNTVVHTYPRGAYDVCLTAVNAFGADTICQTVDLTHVGIEDFYASAIKIYPNPATDNVVIEAKELAGKCTITLYNNAGKQVLQTKIERETLRLDVSTLPAGIYEVQFADNKGKQLLSKSIVINR